MASAGDIGREFVAELGPVIVGIGAGGFTGWAIAAKTQPAAHLPFWSGVSIISLLVIAFGVAVWAFGKAVRKPQGPATIIHNAPWSNPTFNLGGGGGAGATRTPETTGAGSGSESSTIEVALPDSTDQDGDDADS
jgi:hypothetical protein